MKYITSALALVTVSLITGPVRADAPNLQTQGACSPIVHDTGGNVTLNLSCPIQLTPVQLKEIIDSIRSSGGVPADLMTEFRKLSRQFDVQDTALVNFFRILGDKKIPVEDLDAKLREIASRHVSLLNEVKVTQDDDPEVAALKQQAATAIAAGDYDQAEQLLGRARDADIQAAQRIREAATRQMEEAIRRQLRAAESQAAIGQTELTRLRYGAAATAFKAAADLVPPEHPLIRANSLNRAGLGASDAGQYQTAVGPLVEALAIREKALGPDHRDVAASLNNLAELYRAQGRYGEAEPLYQRALVIREKALGPDHPDVAVSLNNLAALYQDQDRLNDAEPLFKRALAINEKALGSDHPSTRLVRENLSSLQSELAASPTGDEPAAPEKAPAD
jgi:tetratricopeptide (TPR) repeat protein